MFNTKTSPCRRLAIFLSHKGMLDGWDPLRQRFTYFSAGKVRIRQDNHASCFVGLHDSLNRCFIQSRTICFNCICFNGQFYSGRIIFTFNYNNLLYFHMSSNLNNLFAFCIVIAATSSTVMPRSSATFSATYLT